MEFLGHVGSPISGAKVSCLLALHKAYIWVGAAPLLDQRPLDLPRVGPHQHAHLLRHLHAFPEF